MPRNLSLCSRNTCCFFSSLRVLQELVVALCGSHSPYRKCASGEQRPYPNYSLFSAEGSKPTAHFGANVARDHGIQKQLVGKICAVSTVVRGSKICDGSAQKSTSSKKDLVAAADSSLLQANQKLVYDIVRSHHELTKSGFECKPLRMNGSAGTGKSYLINCIKEMLGSECILAAPTVVAAFNIGGQTLHSLLRIPLQKTSFSDVLGPYLTDLQERFEDVRYLIIDEMSMVGRHEPSLNHRRLFQALPQGACKSFGGISLIFFGDMGQLPPVGDSPLYRSAATKGSATNQGRQLYSYDV